MLNLSNVCKKWPETEIVFSQEVQDGQMLAICGQSGSGKSTVLRLISGLLPLDGGEIILNGKNITNEKPSKRGIGMVFQNHSLFPHLSVADNVGYGLVSSGMKKKDARKMAKDFLSIFGFGSEAFFERFPDEISGGEAQRVSIARTLIVKPKVVLFDEPLSSLDPHLRRRLALEIKSLQQKLNFTGIFVTHDVQEAKNICDYVTVMKKGKQIWSGTPTDFDEDKFLL